MSPIRSGTVEIRVIGAKPDLRKALASFKAVIGDDLHVYGVNQGKSGAFVGRASLLIPQSGKTF